jgi:putative endonuclease
MASHIDLGKKGELLAQEYLLRENYQLLHINWRHGRREIDIIAMKSGCLVFFEVKTLARELFGWPEQKVNIRKQRNLQLTAEAYMEQMTSLPKAIRFDIIAITFKPDGTHELLHMEDAF